MSKKKIIIIKGERIGKLNRRDSGKCKNVQMGERDKRNKGKREKKEGMKKECRRLGSNL